ncbi:hypothetical protein ACLMAJ_31955 [Nocardia sp. KC 131]|uniref:hypothetical protein n=1 Tax=Nocardia arseniciresistens TaxID=3392119 RepID=UPI00398F12E7
MSEPTPETEATTIDIEPAPAEPKEAETPVTPTARARSFAAADGVATNVDFAQMSDELTR